MSGSTTATTDTASHSSFNKRLKASHQGPALLVDLLMLLVLLTNLAWLIFDSFFASQLVQSAIQAVAPNFFTFYRDEIHPNFIVYDQFFIAIYVTELLIRWGIAIKRRTYYRWFFYPFAHWYDVLGCIPVSSFRWFRLIRVVSILYRLHKHNLINFSNSSIFITGRKYLSILVEEVSDLVVINVLNGVQADIRTGNPIVGKITQEVFDPHKDELFAWVSAKISEVIEVSYQPNRDEIKSYFNETLEKASSKNADVARLQKVPVIGDLIVDSIESLVADLIYQIVDQLVRDLSAANKYQTLEEIVEIIGQAIKDDNSELNRIIMSMVDQGLDIVKDEVGQKQWALKYNVEDFQ